MIVTFHLPSTHVAVAPPQLPKLQLNPSRVQALPSVGVVLGQAAVCGLPHCQAVPGGGGRTPVQIARHMHTIGPTSA